jgi:hypothetical protein
MLSRNGEVMSGRIQHADRLHDHAPNFEGGLFVELNILIFRVLGLEPDARASFAIALDGEFPGQQRQHDRPIDGRARTVDDRDVAGKQPGARHAFAGDADSEGGGRVFDQQIVEVERPVEIVVGGRGKAAGGGCCHQRHRRGLADLDGQERFDVPCPQTVVSH